MDDVSLLTENDQDVVPALPAAAGDSLGSAPVEAAAAAPATAPDMVFADDTRQMRPMDASPSFLDRAKTMDEINASHAAAATEAPVQAPKKAKAPARKTRRRSVAEQEKTLPHMTVVFIDAVPRKPERADEPAEGDDDGDDVWEVDSDDEDAVYAQLELDRPRTSKRVALARNYTELQCAFATAFPAVDNMLAIERTNGDTVDPATATFAAEEEIIFRAIRPHKYEYTKAARGFPGRWEEDAYEPAREKLGRCWER